MGKKADIVCKMLYILSYFIRCSEVLESRLECPLELYESEAGEDALLSSDMSPIRESGFSRTNSRDSMSDLTTGLVADLETAMEASESPPLGGNSGKLTSPSDPVFHLQEGSAASPWRSTSECTIVNSPISPYRTESESTVIGSDMMDNSAMFKSDSTVISIQSDKTLSPTGSCDHLEQTVQHAEDISTQQDEHALLNCDNNKIQDDANIEDQADAREKENKNDNIDVTTCRLSQTSIEEVPRIDNVRSLGREANFNDLQTDSSTLDLRKNNGGSDKFLDAEESEDDSCSCENTKSTSGDLCVPCDKVEQYSQDSGVFDGNSTESQSVGTRDSSVSTCTENLERKDSDNLTVDSNQIKLGGQETGMVYDETTEAKPSSVDPKTIVFTRNNSMFDEYFPDGNVTPTGIPKVVEMRTAKLIESERYKRMASIEGTNSTMDEYMSEYTNVPLPDITSISNGQTVKESSPERERISLKEEYFKEDCPTISMMPAGNAKEQVQHAIQLMKQKSKDHSLNNVELNGSDEMRKEGAVGSGRKSRPSSLVLQSVQRPLSRQNSNAKSPVSSKRYENICHVSSYI